MFCQWAPSHSLISYIIESQLIRPSLTLPFGTWVLIMFRSLKGRRREWRFRFGKWGMMMMGIIWWVLEYRDYIEARFFCFLLNSRCVGVVDWIGIQRSRGSAQLKKSNLSFHPFLRHCVSVCHISYAGRALLSLASSNSIYIFFTFWPTKCSHYFLGHHSNAF